MRKIFTWDILISAATAFTLSYGATFMFVLRLPAAGIFFAVTVICLLLSAVAAHRKAVLRTLPFLPLIVPFGWLTGLYKPFFEFVGEYIEWIWSVAPNPGFERLSVTLLSFAVTVPVFTLIRCRSPAFILMLAGGTLFFGLENAAFDYPAWLFWAFLTAILLQMAHTAGGRGPRRPSGPDGGGEEADGPFSERIKNYQSAKKLRILAALPACLLVVFLSSLIVAPDMDPLGFFRDFTGNISLFPGRRGGSSANDISGIGREMGGPFRPTGQLMLTLRNANGDISAEGPYLRGGLGVFYDGRRWYGDGSEGVELGGNGLLGDSIYEGRQKRYIIRHEGLRGTRLYLPYKTVNVSYPETGEVREDLVWYTGDTVRLRRDPGANLSYRVAVSETFYSRSVYRDWESEADAAYLIRSGNPAVPEESADDFLDLPRELPFRVIGLAYSLAVYGDDYYNALAIERYLVDNFAYNPDMPSTPGDQDFVDHFLFAQKEGYCTYFASAMVIMCRAAGLPARYVDGFAPVSETDGGAFLYTDERAHAWAEVWIKGQGWMQFEPTPGYNRVEGPVYFPEPVRTRPEPVMPSPSIPGQPDMPDWSPPPAGAGGTEAGTEGGGTFPIRVVLNIILLPLALFLAWAVLRVRRMRFEKMLRSIPYGQREVKRIYAHLLWLVSHADVNPKPHETLYEFADRADVAWPTKLYIMRRVADVYSKSCYADSPLSAEESKTLQMYVEILERREHIHLGGTRYWFYSKALSLLPVEREKDDKSIRFEQ